MIGIKHTASKTKVGDCFTLLKLYGIAHACATTLYYNLKGFDCGVSSAPIK